MDKIIGRNPVLEAIRAGRGFEKLIVQDNAEGSIHKLIKEAGENGVIVQYAGKSALDRMAGGGRHQGVVAIVSDFQYARIDDMLKSAAEKGEAPLILVLDGIEDPRNLGAILRSAEGAGAHGVVMPRRRAAGVTEAAAKTAAGAAEYSPVARLANMTRTVEELKSAGLWTAALDMDGDSYFGKDLTGGIAVVVGSEGRGVSRLVKESCDFRISIPMHGRVGSLNASSAAAVILYEIRRQRAARPT
jgi:23S rRNA (guanosine2251-2'-O)-methyltransferase